MERKKYKIINLETKEVNYADLIVNNKAIIEYEVTDNAIKIIKAIDDINSNKYAVLNFTGIKDCDGNYIYDGDIVEVEITVDYRPKGTVAIENGTTLIKYHTTVFEKTVEPLYCAMGDIKLMVV